ncbi:MAG: PD-(D/E)XK nuclease family protein [Elusimicrobia bacterium]|nr:PD-(D/E)XK nuclease family protein [Elusimicrobiota bacterium]
MEISYTRYRIYRECPWKYKLLFADGRRIPMTPKSSFGLSLHRALEAWLRGGERTLESLHEALRAQWLSAGYPDEDAEARWYSKAQRILHRFHGEEESRRSRTVGVEKEFIWTSGAHQVRGMIDRVDQGPDGAYELIDYKTGPGVPTSEEVAKDGQLRFYALGAKRGLNLRPSTLTVDCVAAGERVSAPYDGAGEDLLDADIRAAASGIEAAAFSPKTSFCPRCDFRKECAHSVAKSL